MSVRKDANGKWFYRKRVKLPNGVRVDVSGHPSLNTKQEAAREERAAIQRAVDYYHSPPAQGKEVPTFDEWFNGRYWNEWVTTNKAGTADEKRLAYEHRLKKVFGALRLDEIRTPQINAFRAALLAEKLSRKTINNLITIVTKPLNYACLCEVIASAPKPGILKTERPEIGAWELEEYFTILRAALAEGVEWFTAACLSGEAGMRIGEVRELKWSDIDMKGGTITIARQRRKEIVGTPKGRTRRTIPMTATLLAALGAIANGNGYVVQNDDGTPKRDGQTVKAIYRIYKRAGVPERKGGWHLLRHSFAAHAALFGVNPWTLMKWLGHKRIDETMLYVEFASDHARQMPARILTIGAKERDPDRRTLAMLGGRCSSLEVMSDGTQGVPKSPLSVDDFEEERRIGAAGSAARSLSTASLGELSQSNGSSGSTV